LDAGGRTRKNEKRGGKRCIGRYIITPGKRTLRMRNKVPALYGERPKVRKDGCQRRLPGKREKIKCEHDRIMGQGQSSVAWKGRGREEGLLK